MLRQVPEQLWSKHDTDVGLVKAANPIRIDLKPNVQLPNKPQYPLKPEVVEGMVEEVLNQCEICAENNVRKGVKTPVGHIPVPEGPFKHLCMDYIDMTIVT